MMIAMTLTQAMMPIPMSPSIQTRLASRTAPKTTDARSNAWKHLSSIFSVRAEHYPLSPQRYIRLDSE